MKELEKALQELKLPYEPQMLAQFAAYMLPATMIFVQSKDGLSHCEPEYSSPEHCTEGASVMLNAVLKADAD